MEPLTRQMELYLIPHNHDGSYNFTIPRSAVIHSIELQEIYSTDWAILVSIDKYSSAEDSMFVQVPCKTYSYLYAVPLQPKKINRSTIWKMVQSSKITATTLFLQINLENLIYYQNHYDNTHFPSSVPSVSPQLVLF